MIERTREIRRRRHRRKKARKARRKAAATLGSMADQGQFGIWEETGRFINLALVVGAFEGKGYGESVGSMIENEGVTIPTKVEIDAIIKYIPNSARGRPINNADIVSPASLDCPSIS